VFTFGCGAGGRLGHGNTNSNQLMPRVLEALPEPAVQVAQGEFHAMALTAGGRLYGWGKRAVGHDNARKGLPALVQGLDGVHITQVACGREHTVAVSEDGTAYTWGIGSGYALGHGTKDETPLPKAVEALRGAWLVILRWLSPCGMASVCPNLHPRA